MSAAFNPGTAAEIFFPATVTVPGLMLTEYFFIDTIFIAGIELPRVVIPLARA